MSVHSYGLDQFGRPIAVAAALALTCFLARPPLYGQAEQSPTTKPAAATAQSHPSTAAPVRTLPVFVAGQRVYIDPQTGRLRPPTPEEAKELSDAMAKLMSRTDGNLDVVHGPGGMMSVVLDGTTMDVSVATLNSDGTVGMQCLPAKEADAAVKRGLPLAASKKPAADPKAPKLEDKE